MRHIIKITFFLPSIIFLFSFSQVHASTSGVSSGNVTAGSKVQARFSYSIDNDSASQDDRIRMRQHLEHGFSDNYALRFIVGQDKRKSASLKNTSFRIEQRVQFFDQKQNGINGTLRFGYRQNASAADEIQLRLNGSTRIPNDLQYKQNIIFGHEVADNSRSGVSLETRFALEKKYKDYAVGVDVFTNFGNLRDLSGYSSQSHTIGPYFKNTLFKDVSYEVGYRQGISKNATDHSVRFFLGYSF